ncbi:hypothetical protein [Flavobacterium sp.]|uniref:hypothetical protein n=1 Tax=Flavobacterium sp. TaxID=239 RepID=UPI001223DB84|nr:hypothetical protein [Flavobacterium sp.]RZJ73371.1 MAG: hypothetical protein EOO49_03405 [Flavobacterium sp.]
MITIGTFLAFLGFLAGYNTSAKAILTGDSKLELWFRSNSANAKTGGLLLLVASLMLVIMQKGIGAGSFMFFVILMTVASLVVLLSPLKILNLKTALIVFVFLFVVEMSNLV